MSLVLDQARKPQGHGRVRATMQGREGPEERATGAQRGVAECRVQSMGKEDYKKSKE